MEEAGYELTVVVDTRSEIPEDEVRSQIDAFFGVKFSGRIVANFDSVVAGDLAIATCWSSAYAVARNRGFHRKAYLVQDFEALFHPMGSDYLLAENSYTFGLTPITIGRWLTRLLFDRFSVRSHYFDFCADLSIYRPATDQQTAPHSVVFTHQPEKPRRCAELGLAALSLVKARMPDVNIHLYGSNASQHVPFEHIQHGLLTVDRCNELYNRSSLGLCLSSSNPSRVPFEMMAAGLPVVDIWRDNNRYDYPEDCATLALQQPEAIADTLTDLLLDRARRQRMRRAGLALMAARSLEAGNRQFLAAIDTVVQGNEANARTWQVPRPLYPKVPGGAAGHRRSNPAEPILPRREPTSFTGEQLLPFLRPCAQLLAAGHRRAVVCGAGPAGRAAAHLLNRLGIVVTMYSDRKFHYFGGRIGATPVVPLDAALADTTEAFLIGSLAYWPQIRDEIGDRCAALGRPVPDIYCPDIGVVGAI
jgi:glycosyltransferase involved in cell wall biosynthesis